MKTDKKYTMVVSAYQAGNTLLENMVATQALHHFLERTCHVHAVHVISVHRDIPAQAFLVHTNSSNIMGQIRRAAFERDSQECLLIRNNRKHDIQLHYLDTCKHIGKDFSRAERAAHSYIILNGTDYWSVI